jgi:hypothetical protein
MKNKERRRLSTQWQNLEAIIGLILAILLVVGYLLLVSSINELVSL